MDAQARAESGRPARERPSGIAGLRAMASDQDITGFLVAWRAGDRNAADALFPTVYGELRRIAHRQLGRERPDHTLGTTALVHEAYLKLARLDRIAWHGHAHFLGVAAQAMRRVLVDYAVARRTLKRGGAARRVAALDDVASGDLVAADALVAAATRADELLALDDALTALAALDERQARVVECRFFAGMSVEETAD